MPEEEAAPSAFPSPAASTGSCTWRHARHSAAQPQHIAGEEGALHFSAEHLPEPRSRSIPKLHISSISQLEHLPHLRISQPEPSPSTTTGSRARRGLVYPPRGKCLWGRTTPDQAVGHLGAPVHRSSTIKKSQARGVGRGKKHMLRCLGCCSQFLPTLEESFEFLALDVATARSLFSQNLLVLKATTHTSIPLLRRNE